MSELTRRGFFMSSAAALPLAPLAASSTASEAAPATGDPSSLRWLDAEPPALQLGQTLGLPWPRGRVKDRKQDFLLRDGQGQVLPLQSWPLAYWPDGSLKWTAHAMPAGVPLGQGLKVEPGTPAAPKQAVVVKEEADTVSIDTGLIRAVLPRSGEQLIRSIERGGKQILRACHLIAQTDDQPDSESGAVRQTQFRSAIRKLTVEQRGPVRAVVKIEGEHKSQGRGWLPFSVRLYFYAGAESVRVMHTFVFDGDEHKDFLRGIGLRFEVPMRDALHDRHVRIAGENGGLWAEGVRNLTGLRRDPGAAVRAAQLAGQACPPLEQWGAQVRKLHHRIPAWGDYSLGQLSADGFQIRKRTKAGHGWIPAAWGHRAPGSGYIGGASGGVVFGLRDFWQRHPTQLDIRNAVGEAAEVTVWMHSPEAPAMDLRFYHDGLGMETHEQELEGLEVTYEDYEKGFGTPLGIARSSEITLWAVEATPTRERQVEMAKAVQTPPQLVASPERLLQAGVFGRLWSLPDRSTPARARIEDKLDFLFGFYAKEVEQRHWYGFWDYGDIRHTYDSDRHEWRYDVGGFAWDNSELSPDLWLWYAFLRSGRADIFRFAEAMVRHTSEVDIYHAGRFQGLGTRHNVQHWGCSAKQVRISTSAYRRFYYYLTADERVGDVMRELLEVDRKLNEVDPIRKITAKPPKGDYPSRIGFGTDWCSLVANWLTEWERTGSNRWRSKILRGMEGIAGMPYGFFSASPAGYEPEGGNEGALHNINGKAVAASHLNAVFGAVEILAELVELIEVPAFQQAWLQYCELYNAGKEEQARVLGAAHGGSPVLSVGHSRLTAFAARKKGDKTLAARAWREFLGDDRFGAKPTKTQRIAGPAVLNPVDEAAWVSTNDTAQWGLAAIQNLALVGEHLPG
ncbi:Tat pathway signal sequence domain protein [Pelomonas sp. SE-A7]|uniref:exo-rhamnogalacturonan lyase family protein n=1 Tax=Pelomonas sp. SE-A7 TaxID=3054953 RepID=UPI00259CC15F|nr:Tat pathway signal sequence domain protein [Pelomonas sp. SE-A7]MDM4765228.1 Tat pathway signal sequence domain protein [Pelomonas sp. SE-A7]